MLPSLLGGVTLDAVGEAVFVQLAIERRAPDSQRPGDARHAPVIVLDSEGDEGALDLGQSSDFARLVEETVGCGLRLRIGQTLAGRGVVDMNRGGGDRELVEARAGGCAPGGVRHDLRKSDGCKIDAIGKYNGAVSGGLELTGSARPVVAGHEV